MIKRKVEKQTYSIISVLNYDKYQGNEKVKRGNKKEDNDGFDRDKTLRFLLSDEEYAEYMKEQGK